MLDSGLDKILDNTKKQLINDVEVFLEREEQPTDEEWIKYTKNFNKYFEYKKKLSINKLN